MTRAMRLVPLAVVAALALGGCHAHTPIPATTEGEWARARDAATRRRFLYDRFDHRATATATHLSMAVREARARRLALWFGWTPEELARDLAAERRDAAQGEEFIVSFYTAQSKWNDLDAPRSVWRLAVKLGATDYVATKVTALEHDATVMGLFPYVGQFDVVYRVVFPPVPGDALAASPFTFELASALGKLDLEYGDGGGGPAQPEEPHESPR